ncbi:hypothetical protein AB1Y20_009326 [Prymnesium parvum]|uniref:CMP/dCMP-type deaminase domain-containing protein n=1 Tax=Prymnesium parvum TaxID=97485 RepID=A0AB34K1A4_PRYPA
MIVLVSYTAREISKVVSTPHWLAAGSWRSPGHSRSWLGSSPHHSRSAPARASPAVHLILTKDCQANVRTHMLRRLCLKAAAASAALAATTAAAHAAAKPSAPDETEEGKRRRLRAFVSSTPSPGGLELLVHNISHSDLYVMLRRQEGTGEEKEEFSVLARPKFSEFQPASELILAHLDALKAKYGDPVVNSCNSKYKVRYPIGLSLTQGGAAPGACVTGEDRPGNNKPQWARFHLKGFKRHDGTPPKLPEGNPTIMEVFMPLVAVLIPEWLRVLKRKETTSGMPPPRKVLILVSGAGQPRDTDANPQDNSTEGTGRIIQRFVEAVYPDIEVICIPSNWSIFRYDDNVNFVKQQVLPVVEAKRRKVVEEHGEEWNKRLHVTLSLSDGAPARISAINASMRSYRPDYLHIWRTKTFWDEQVISEEDVEFHTFKKLEMRPAAYPNQMGELERGLVREMASYKRQFEAVRDANSHELESFWLRKTGKAVVAVLVTQKPGEAPVFWRGLNVEVSMPTGTLCAERNAIGNALAGDQTMCRSDMKGVAVLSIPLNKDRVEDRDDTVALNPLDPCGACMEWLKKIAEVNPDFMVLTFTNTACEKVYVTPIGDYA